MHFARTQRPTPSSQGAAPSARRCRRFRPGLGSAHRVLSYGNFVAGLTQLGTGLRAAFDTPERAPDIVRGRPSPGWIGRGWSLSMPVSPIVLRGGQLCESRATLNLCLRRRARSSGGAFDRRDGRAVRLARGRVRFLCGPPPFVGDLSSCRRGEHLERSHDQDCTPGHVGGRFGRS